jgi:hypothetical protein
MSKLSYPNRIYSLSDCHGGAAVWNPLESPDAAARLAESIRSDFDEPVQRVDTLGVHEQYYRHVVREVLRLHEENPASGRSGLFINSAPRTKEGDNGHPFYRADFEGERLVVVTNLPEALSAVRKRVSRLQFLPNRDNGLYPNREQHRSSYTPRMLADNHGLHLRDADPDEIPEYQPENIVSYVDRFGNLALEVRQQLAIRLGQRVNLHTSYHTKPVVIGECLSAARPGELVAYQNDGNLEVLSKWDASWRPKERLSQSAYSLFGRPKIGEAWNFSESSRSHAIPEIPALQSAGT